MEHIPNSCSLQRWVLQVSYVQREKGLFPLLQEQLLSLPAPGEVLARSPHGAFPGGTRRGDAAHHAVPPRAPGLRTPAPGTLCSRNSLSPGPGGGGKRCSSPPGSPPTQIMALTESAEFPRCPWGMERFIVGFFISLQYRSCTAAVCSPRNGKEIMHLG